MFDRDVTCVPLTYNLNLFDDQFIAMCEKRRCSILFHLLVPGGK